MKTPAWDIVSQEYKRNPYPTLAAIIAAGPVTTIRFPLLGSIKAAVTYDAVQDLLRDRETFVREPRSAGLKKGANLPWWLPRSMRTMAEGMINRDEPDHRRLRGLVEQAFIRRNIDLLRPRFESLANQMLDELEMQQRRNGKPVDLVAGLARPFPLAVICELLGLPAADRPMFTKNAEAIARNQTAFGVIRMLLGIRQIARYVRERIADAKKHPQEGLISALIAAEHDGQRLTEAEMETMIVLLLFAGHITTVHLIGAGIYTLYQHPDQRQRFTADRSLLTSTVHELLRYLSPVQMTKPMMAARDLDWHGRPLCRGERIVAFLAAANVDPEQFPDPTRFDIARNPNPHVAFGAGIHVCLGWKLAVAETEIALDLLFRRFPRLELILPPSGPRWSGQLGTRGLESLPALFS